MINLVLIAFIIGLASIVTKIGADIILQRKCLDNSTIQEFITGRLKKDREEYRRVIAHLGICQQCRQKMKHFSFEDNIEDHLIE